MPVAEKYQVRGVGSTCEVRAELVRLGWPSLSAWAHAMGYKPVTARATVLRWGQRTDRTPHGGIARALMGDLRRTLDRGIGATRPKLLGH